MESVKKIMANYKLDNFGAKVKVNKRNKKSVIIESFWGEFSQYQKLRKELLDAGYTVFE